jgi:hypothetical protein
MKSAAPPRDFIHWRIPVVNKFGEFGVGDHAMLARQALGMCFRHIGVNCVPVCFITISKFFLPWCRAVTVTYCLWAAGILQQRGIRCRATLAKLRRNQTLDVGKIRRMVAALCIKQSGFQRVAVKIILHCPTPWSDRGLDARKDSSNEAPGVYRTKQFSGDCACDSPRGAM